MNSGGASFVGARLASKEHVVREREAGEHDPRLLRQQGEREAQRGER